MRVLLGVLLGCGFRDFSNCSRVGEALELGVVSGCALSTGAQKCL